MPNFVPIGGQIPTGFGSTETQQAGITLPDIQDILQNIPLLTLLTTIVPSLMGGKPPGVLELLFPIVAQLAGNLAVDQPQAEIAEAAYSEQEQALFDISGEQRGRTDVTERALQDQILQAISGGTPELLQAFMNDILSRVQAGPGALFGQLEKTAGDLLTREAIPASLTQQIYDQARESAFTQLAGAQREQARGFAGRGMQDTGLLEAGQRDDVNRTNLALLGEKRALEIERVLQNRAAQERAIGFGGNVVGLGENIRNQLGNLGIGAAGLGINRELGLMGLGSDLFRLQTGREFGTADEATRLGYLNLAGEQQAFTEQQQAWEQFLRAMGISLGESARHREAKAERQISPAQIIPPLLEAAGGVGAAFAL